MSNAKRKKIITDLGFKTYKKSEILAHESDFVCTGVKTLLSYAKKERVWVLYVKEK